MGQLSAERAEGNYIYTLYVPSLIFSKKKPFQLKFLKEEGDIDQYFGIQACFGNALQHINASKTHVTTCHVLPVGFFFFRKNCRTLLFAQASV